MEIVNTELEGCVILEPKVFKDERGFFFESFNERELAQLLGKNLSFVQDNESFSVKGVLRGLHFQSGSHAQTKLIRVVKGEILDVIVDLRPKSPTFLSHIKVKLSSGNKKQLFIPKNFAHGFVVLSETAIVNYKCDSYYNKESESGIMFNDPDLSIDWEVDTQNLILSNKDKNLPFLKEIIQTL